MLVMVLLAMICVTGCVLVLAALTFRPATSGAVFISVMVMEFDVAKLKHEKGFVGPIMMW